jgi:hypothetical protein
MDITKVVFASSYTLPCPDGSTVIGGIELWDDSGYGERRDFTEEGHRANGEYSISGGLKPFDIVVKGFLGTEQDDINDVIDNMNSLNSGITSSGIHSLQLVRDTTVERKYNVQRVQSIKFDESKGEGVTRFTVYFRCHDGIRII